MGDTKQPAEWLMNADFCRNMAQRSNDPARRARWLKLAQQWLALCEATTAPDTESQQFEAAVHDKGTGQQASKSSN